jgi:hypothetical protein
MKAFDSEQTPMEYRIVFIDPGTHKVLAIANGNQPSLPRVSIAPGGRAIPQLCRAIKNAWGVHAFFLGEISARDADTCCALAELVSGPLPDALRITDLDAVMAADLTDGERSVVRRVLKGEHDSLFLRMRWITEAVHWVETATGQRITSEMDIEQHAAGGSFALLRFSLRNSRVCWMKANCDQGSHEMSVSELLSKLCPGYVPHVVDVKPDWNAWIMMAGHEDRTLADIPSPYDFDRIEQAVNAIAELQIKTAGHTDALLKAGAFNQKVPVLQAKAAELFSKIEEAMRLQTSTKVVPITANRLAEILRILEDTCSFLEVDAIPSTVLHGDQNAGNIVFGAESCHFIDWCEAYVGHPMIALQHLLPLNEERMTADKVASDQRLVTAYRKILSRVCDERCIDRSIACLPLLAAASTLFGRGTWLSSPLSKNPTHQAHVRTLARYMDGAAQDTRLLKALAA